MEEYAIGIDLGTTNTCVAVLKKNKNNPEIIENDMGCKVTPSWVAFTDAEHLVGDAAKAQASVNPENTIFEAKRIIGRKINEPEVQSKLTNWPFSVIKDVTNGNPSYEVTYKNDQKVMSPEQISSMVLGEVKKSAEERLGCPVTQAVITVPAYFNDSQRQATIDAGEIAGLEVLEIINEPTAAAIAYGMDRRGQDEINVLVFDFGGGTFDIAIIGITPNNFDVKAVSGDKDLGGGDIDNLLVKHFVNKFKTAFGVNLMTNSRAISRLRTQCEIAKCNLSSSLKQKVHVDSIHEGHELDEWLSCVKMEDICTDLFDRVIDPIEAALEDAGMTKDQIDEVLLVGGTTRIPSIQTRVKDFFDGKKLNKTVNPDEVVAVGAAIWASRLSGNKGLEEVNLSDVIPVSLGIAVRNEDMSVIIPRNTKIPTTKTRDYSTHSDNQTCVKIEVFTGENKKCAGNERLGEFILNNIKQAPKGIPRISVKFHVDRNGILAVSAEDLAEKGCKNSLQIDSYKGRLSQQEIDTMVLEAKKLNLNKEQIRSDQSARNELESFASKMKRGCTKRYKKKAITVETLKKIDSACLEILEWIEENSDSSATECEQKLTRLREFCSVTFNDDDIANQSTALA